MCALSLILCLSNYSLSFLSLDSWLYSFLSSVLSIASNIPMCTGLVVMEAFSLFISWEVFLSPATITGSFAGYSSLGWHPWFLRTCSMLFWACLRNQLLLWWVLLSMWLVASPLKLSMSFLCSVYLVSYQGYTMNNFFSGLVYSASCVLFMSVLVCLSLTRGTFLLWPSWRAGLCHWWGIPLLPLCPSFIDLLFHSTSRFRRVPFVCLFTLIVFHWLAQWLYFIFES